MYKANPIQREGTARGLALWNHQPSKGRISTAYPPPPGKGSTSCTCITTSLSDLYRSWERCDPLSIHICLYMHQRWTEWGEPSQDWGSCRRRYAFLPCPCVCPCAEFAEGHCIPGAHFGLPLGCVELVRILGLLRRYWSPQIALTLTQGQGRREMCCIIRPLRYDSAWGRPSDCSRVGPGPGHCRPMDPRRCVQRHSPVLTLPADWVWNSQLPPEFSFLHRSSTFLQS